MHTACIRKGKNVDLSSRGARSKSSVFTADRNGFEVHAEGLIVAWRPSDSDFWVRSRRVGTMPELRMVEWRYNVMEVISVKVLREFKREFKKSLLPWGFLEHWRYSIIFTSRLHSRTLLHSPDYLRTFVNLILRWTLRANFRMVIQATKGFTSGFEYILSSPWKLRCATLLPPMNANIKGTNQN